MEITPRPAGGLSDEGLLDRLKWIQSEVQVALVAKELAEARQAVAKGRAKDGEAHVMAIHERFAWRMHDLSQFMQGFLQRYTQWHNGKTKRKGLTKEQLDAEKRRLMEAEEKRMGEIPFGRMLRCRVRYFTDGAIIGSKESVNAAFESGRGRFGTKRNDGARSMRGNASGAKGMLWTARDLRVGV